MSRQKSMLLGVAKQLDEFAEQHRHASTGVLASGLPWLLTKLSIALTAQLGHDRQLLHEFIVARREKVPKDLSRNDALVGPLFAHSALWQPSSGREFLALGRVLLRFFHFHIGHVGVLLDKGDAARAGVARLCELLSDGVIEYVFLLHQPLALAVGKGLLVEGRRNPLLHSRTWYESALQAYYRDVSGLMFFDYQPQASVPALRTAIELKLREAIGIGGFEFASGRLKIINVSEIIESRAQLQLESPTIPLTHVHKIYQWTNYALHGGHRPAVSLIWFVLDYLAPFLRGALVQPRFITANPVWSGLNDEQLETVLRRVLKVPEDARAIGVERTRGPTSE